MSIAEKRTAIGVVQGNIDEAGELVSACESLFKLLYHRISQLDQMDLEIHDVPTELRPQFTQRMKTYKKELDRLRKDFVRHRILNHNKYLTPSLIIASVSSGSGR